MLFMMRRFSSLEILTIFGTGQNDSIYCNIYSKYGWINEKERNKEGYVMSKEKEYVIKAQAGDEEGFRKLYDLYYQKAFYIALKISNFCEADAQDIVQDTFMEIHRSLKNLQKPENFKAWMIRILISKSSHKFRDNRDLFVEPEKFLKMEGFSEHRDYMLPQGQLNNEEDKKVLMKLVDQLKPKQKEVLILQYFEHMSMKEIAEVLQIPEGTVKTRIMYAKNELKELVCAYEKKEGRRLGFQADSLSAALSVAFAKEFAAFCKPKVQVLPKQTFKQKNWMYHAGIAVCCATFVVTGFGAFHEITKNEMSQTSNTPFVEETKQFNTVYYRGEAITNCRDAYYTLKEWAQNPQRMALRSQAEAEEIQVVYRALKEYQGTYYEKLTDVNWTSAYETKIK